MMRTLCTDWDDDLKVREFTDNGKSLSWTYIDSDIAAELVASEKAIMYESHDVLEKALEYQQSRRREYPSIEDQLDYIYHEGIDAWKETIQAVKDAHPKPE